MIFLMTTIKYKGKSKVLHYFGNTWHNSAAPNAFVGVEKERNQLDHEMPKYSPDTLRVLQAGFDSLSCMLITQLSPFIYLLLL